MQQGLHWYVSYDIGQSTIFTQSPQMWQKHILTVESFILVLELIGLDQRIMVFHSNRAEICTKVLITANEQLCENFLTQNITIQEFHPITKNFIKTHSMG